MKKIIALLISVALLFSFAGCVGIGVQTDGPYQETSTTVTETGAAESETKADEKQTGAETTSAEPEFDTSAIEAGVYFDVSDETNVLNVYEVGDDYIDFTVSFFRVASFERIFAELDGDKFIIDYDNEGQTLSGTLTYTENNGFELQIDTTSVGALGAGKTVFGNRQPYDEYIENYNKTMLLKNADGAAWFYIAENASEASAMLTVADVEITSMLSLHYLYFTDETVTVYTLINSDNEAVFTKSTVPYSLSGSLIYIDGDAYSVSIDNSAEPAAFFSSVAQYENDVSGYYILAKNLNYPG